MRQWGGGNCWKKWLEKWVIRTSSVIGHGIRTMATTLFTACCQCKQAPSATSILCRSVVRGAWGIHLCSFWLCIPQKHQQKHIWIINLSVSLCFAFATTSDSEEGVTVSVHGTLDRLLSKAASFKKKSILPLPTALRLLFKVTSSLSLILGWKTTRVVHYSALNEERKFGICSVDVSSQLGALQSCNKMMSLFFKNSNLKKFHSFTALKSV